MNQKEWKQLKQERLEARYHCITYDDTLNSNCFIKKLHISKSFLKKNLDEDKRFFCEDFNFKPGVNLLFGENGQGKSSLLEYLKVITQDINKVQDRNDYKYRACLFTVSTKPFKTYYYSNSECNARYNFEPVNEMQFLRHFQSKERSEGQSAMQSISDFFYVLENDEYLKPDDNAVILIDEIDSGLDACMCRYIVYRLKKLMKKKHNLQLFISFNQYEMMRLDSKYLNVCDGQLYSTPDSYDKYMSLLNNNKKLYKRKIDTEIRR